MVSSKKWIILLNKSPRGPFSEDEIKELMTQGLLRPNDLGFLVPQEGEPQDSAWKFLWQFSEFDSRLKERENPPPPAVLEKRKPRSEAQIQKDIDEHVPLDLKTIRVEDLILKTQAVPKRDFSSSKQREERETLSQKKIDSDSLPSKTRPLFAVLGMGAVAAFVFLVIQEFKATSSKTSSRNLTSSESPGESPSKGLKKGSLPSARKAEELSKAAPKTPPPSSKPVERDRGEIREEELLRIREEERKRELEEQLRQKRLEEERNREENEEDEAEEAEEENKKSKGSKRKPNRNVEPQEETEEDFEDSNAKEISADDEAPPPNWID